MSQWRSLTAQFGFDEDEWIALSNQPYSAGANASESGAYQVAPDDREHFALVGDTCSGPNSNVAMFSAFEAPPQAFGGIPCASGSPGSGFQFVSRSVVLEDNSKAKSKKRSNKPDTGIRCEFPGCRYSGTFNRKHDLQRHMGIHDNVRKERCPVEFCDQYFHRHDKLLKHLRTVHADTEEAICPFSQCNMRLPFLIMFRHFAGHAFGLSRRGIICTTGVSLDWRPVRSCPIPSCKHNAKNLPAHEIQEHLRRHAKKERDSNSAEILAAGYDPVSVKVVCPVCKTHLPALVDFKHHLQNEHIFKNEFYAQNLAGYDRDLYGVYDFWRTTPVSHYLAKIIRVEPGAHIPNLRPYDEYAQHRWAILRLWPDFQHHPLFDEFEVARNSEQSGV